MALDTNLISYYQFNGNSNDSKGSNNLTNTNSPTYTTGKLNQCIEFNGTTQYTSGTVVDPDSYGSGFSWGGWVYWDSQNTSQKWFACIPENAGWGTCYIGNKDGSNGDGTTFVYKFGNAQSGFYGTDSNVSIPVATWFHVVATVNGNVQKLYLNGSLIATATKSGSMANNSSNFYFGSGNGAYYWNGKVCEFGVWGAELSADEVSQLYNSGRGNAYPLTDTPSLYGGVAYYKLDGNSNDSVGSNNGTDTSISYSSSYGKINQGASFNGSSSKIWTNNNLGLSTSSDKTFGMWYYRTGGTTSFTLDYRNNSGGNFSLTFYTNSTGGIIFNCKGTDVVTSSNLSTNTWYYLTTVISGSTLTAYVNGVSIGSGTIGSGTTNANNFSLSSYADTPGGYFQGYIDEVGIWSRVLSSGEVSELYNSGAGLQYPFTTDKPSLFPFFNNYI